MNHVFLPPESNGLQADAVAERPALNLFQRRGKLDGNDSPLVKKGTLPNLFNPLRNLHMLQIRQKFCQTPPLQLHHPQDIYRNGANQAGNRHLPGHHLHCVWKHIFPSIRKGDFRNPAAASEHITETVFLQLRGNLQFFQHYIVYKYLFSQIPSTGNPHLGKAVTVEKRAVSQLRYGRRKRN